jgi:uncharacterized protein YjbI with pentapeptide repeats
VSSVTRSIMQVRTSKAGAQRRPWIAGRLALRPASLLLLVCAASAWAAAPATAATRSSPRDVKPRQAVGVSIRSAALHAVDLAGSELEQLHVLDATLRGCNLANVVAPRAALVRVAVTGCRLTGITMFEAFLRDVTFASCRIDLASFGSCRLQQITFEDCLLTQTDFLESELQSVRFHGCDLTQADFRGARLDRCELRGCDLAGAHGVDRLAGAAMPWADIVEHAGTWAAALGIEVLDDD